MRGVARAPMTSFSRRPQVRYFGAEQEAGANQLRDYLNREVSTEALEITTPRTLRSGSRIRL